MKKSKVLRLIGKQRPLYMHFQGSKYANVNNFSTKRVYWSRYNEPAYLSLDEAKQLITLYLENNLHMKASFYWGDEKI